MHFTYQNIRDNQEEELKHVTAQGVPNGYQHTQALHTHTHTHTHQV